MRVALRARRVGCGLAVTLGMWGSPFGAATERLSAQDVPLSTVAPATGVTSYDPSIPRPEDVLGYLVGEAHSEPWQIGAYVDAVAASSDRVVAGMHGRTVEGRPLVQAIITSPGNHARLDMIREANLRISDAPGTITDSDLREMPVILWMGYSVHGNEASGSEAALLLLYHLAAGEGEVVERWLEEAVVLLVPDLNPDGRQRFTGWANANRGSSPVIDPNDREHREPWPGGRTNHYWFDLNRDWLPGQLPESQGRLELFHSWRPQVLTDHHEMGSESTFFFQPGVPSRTNPITPEENQELTARIAGFHAQALDRVGQLYYSGESFDDFYYGKGSTYPDVNGAIGILFEQASSRALQRETSTGVLEYGLTVRNQFITSLSTLEAATALKAELLSFQHAFYRDAISYASDQEIAGYVVSLEEGRTRAQQLGRLLQRHRVRLYELGSDVDADGRTYRAGRAYVVPLAQPQARLIRAAMERTSEFRDSLFYDVSAWTLPLAFDVVYSELDAVPGRMIGAELRSMSVDGGVVAGGSAEYAYLLEWDRFGAAAALFALQGEGLIARVLRRDIEMQTGAETRSFAAGTIVIPVVQPGKSRGEVNQLVEAAADQHHVRVTSVSTGLTESGPDLGGAGTSIARLPTVGLVVGPGSSSNRAGEVWHLLSERAGLPVSLLNSTDLDDLDLRSYDLIILPDGSYGEVDASRFTDWLQAGGRLVALGSSAKWLVANEIIELIEIPFEIDSVVAGLSFEDSGTARGAQAIGGVILRTELDATHPLAWGIGSDVPVFRRGSTFYESTGGPGEAVGSYADEVLLSGYLSSHHLERAAGAMSVAVRRVGRGRVILFADAVAFRGFWLGSSRLILNAVAFWETF